MVLDEAPVAPATRPGDGPLTPDPGTLGGFLTHVAARFGPNVALAMKPGFRTQLTTYAELEALATRAGALLQSRGVAKGDRVLIWAPNAPAWVAAFFGCHKIGAVVVPLDVRSSASFVASVVRATQPKLAFLSRQTALYADAVGTSRILLDELPGLLADQDLAIESVAGAPGDLAEIMFTSGTTGDPKGVMLTHDNILSNVAGAGEVIEIEPRFRLLSLLPLSHMLEQTVGLLAPLSGGSRVVYPTSRQPALLIRTIAEQRVTMMVLVPQALQLFTNAIEREAEGQGRTEALEQLFRVAEHLPNGLRRVLFRRVHQRFGGKLELLVCGGAHLEPELARRWELMGMTVLQGYGATETSPIISCDRPGHRAWGAVGQAFPNVEIKTAADGEILARGPNVFSGYWSNPEATAAVLDQGWYRTGDLGELDARGFLSLKGRKKDLIVLANGQNVYPEDVEDALKHAPGVVDAAVIGRAAAGGQRVHAALLMDGAADPAAAIRDANARLGDHQQIQGYTVWPDEDFPRTHTLKIKKQEVIQRLSALETPADGANAEDGAQPVWEGSGHSGERASRSVVEAHADPIESLIAQLSGVPIAQILPTSALGGELGLDSLSRVELLSSIEEELGAYVDETQITPDTTVADLRRLVASAEGRAEAEEVAKWPLHPLTAIPREAFLQGIIFPFYHLSWRTRVVGQERLAEIEGPVVIASNHHFQISQGYGAEPSAVWMALPRRLRMRVCTAGDPQAVFGGSAAKAFICRLCNTFPMAKQGSVRASLDSMGRLLDAGWSVLIFPEGHGYDGGPLRPFMGGTGLMAVEGRTPIVPVWIELERRSIVQIPRGRGRGAYTVYIGKPLVFEPGSSAAEATAAIQAAVQALDPRLGGR